jgi:hypothetical protein
MFDYPNPSWVGRDGENKEMCYVEICYLRGHFAKN